MGFVFGKNTAEIEILGTTYTVDPFSEAVLTGMNEYRDALEAAGSGDRITPDDVERVCALGRTFLDAVLGPGAYGRAFAGRDANFLDHQELIAYVCERILSFRALRVLEFSRGGAAGPRESAGA